MIGIFQLINTESQKNIWQQFNLKPLCIMHYKSFLNISNALNNQS